jgi:5'-nucleotidase
MTKHFEDILKHRPLRIGISTRALFDLETEHAIFKKEGINAYINFQLENENTALEKGAGFDVIEQLLKLNKKDKPFVEVILLSRNSPDLSLRAFNSIQEYDLNIKLGSFTSGRSIAPFVNAWDIDLFLSNENSDVKDAIKAGSAAAKLGTRPKHFDSEFMKDEVRIAFDGDAVVFSEESDQIYKDQGLDAFLKHETENANKPMAGGPFGEFLKKLSVLRSIYLDKRGVSKVRISIVTARNAPAHTRVIQTLRAWGAPADEAHFVGANDKFPILKACHAHIFFDDQEKHILGASTVVAAGHVPGPHDPNKPIIPSK